MPMPAGDAAWLVALPCAVVATAIVFFLGPPVSRLLYPAQLPFRFLAADHEAITPEPLEGTRYLLALGAPLLLALTTIVLARRRPRPWPATGTLVRVTQAFGATFVVLCIAAQHRAMWKLAYFSVPTLLGAAAVAAAIVLAIHDERLRSRAAALLARDSGRLRAGLLAAAATLTALWLLPGIDTAHSVTWAINSHDQAFHFDETFAVLNGLTPLESFNAQYASLMPFAIALSMLVFGKALIVFGITVCAISLLALLGIYDVLRRATSSALGAFALYLPFLATSLFIALGTTVSRFSPGTYFPMFPFRYGGPYLLAWLLARRLERKPDARTWTLFLLAGLVILNNFEFGVVAFGATVAALVWTTVEPSWREARRLLLGIALGLAGAFALYSVVTLARGGSLPQIGKALQFARLYALAGYSVAPIPGIIGLPLVIYLTYVAAIGTATVRALDRAPGRVLTGMLVWSGVFGLGSASYYVARSNWGLLPMTFSAWALSLALLAIVVVRRLLASPTRRPSLATLAVLFGIGIAAGSLTQFPLPWAQIQRLRTPPHGSHFAPLEWSLPPTRNAAIRNFISSLADGPGRFVVRRGAPVALFVTTGHRIADAYGIVNVVPYTGPESIHTVEQVEDSLDALRDAGGNTVLIDEEHAPLIVEVLERRGFALVTDSGLRSMPIGSRARWSGVIEGAELSKWVDTRHLRAAWLH